MRGLHRPHVPREDGLAPVAGGGCARRRRGLVDLLNQLAEDLRLGEDEAVRAGTQAAARDGAPPAGRVVLGTVQGDLHDIGKNLVGILLRGAGWEVIDLGTDVPATRFLEAAESSGARVIGLSALLTTTMPRMAEVVALLRERGLSGRVKVVVGGAPVTQAFADEIGADGWGFDAESAVRRVKILMESA
ncbi:MAG: cobalamin-dependent protein [Holophagales bacterium]|nr:cobalamin-dependent protein [Holophagales bacterium]